MDLSGLSARRLSVFVAVAEEGNIARAARTLGTSQPALSRRIAALEGEIGTRLFVRTGRGVTLTEAGAVLLEHARQVLSTMDAAADALGAATGRVSGEVRLGLPPTVAHVLALPLTQALRQRYPAVSVTVMEGYSGHVLDWLSRGAVDIGILYQTGTTTDLVADLLHEEDLDLIAPPAVAAALPRTITGAGLAGQAMILPSRAHGLRQLVEARFAAFGLTPDVQLQVDAFTTTLRMVEAGLGCTILPRVSVADRIAAGTLSAVAIRQPVLSRRVMLATSPARPPSRAVASLAAYARSYARDDLGAGGAGR